MTSPQPIIRIGIAAIFKNEAPYILEWLAHHRLQGFTDFFIADNESTDGSGELLHALSNAGLIHHQRFPNPPSGKPQLPAYRELLKRFGAQVDWMAIVDADEFIWPQKPDFTVIQWLASLGPTADVGAIALNWAVYGSGGSLRATPEPMTQRLSARAEQGFWSNHHFKSLVRPQAVLDVINPHCVALHSPYRYVHADGTACRQSRPGLSEVVHWKPVRINHYVVKSWTEYMLRKRPRGTADGPDDGYPAAFFHEHDRNEVVEPVGTDYLRRLNAEVLALQRLLSRCGFEGIPPTSCSDSSVLPEGLFQGSLEAVACDEQGVLLTGWALSRHRVPMERFLLSMGSACRLPLHATSLHREDVARLYPMSIGDAGFAIRVPWSRLEGADWEHPTLIGQDSTGLQERIPAGPLVNWSGARQAGQLGCDISGHIDSVEVSGDHLVLRGWGLDWGRFSLRSIEVLAGGHALVPLTFEHTHRPDVVAVHQGAEPSSGFLASFQAPLTEVAGEVIGISANGGRCLLCRIRIPQSSH